MILTLFCAAPGRQVFQRHCFSELVPSLALFNKWAKSTFFSCPEPSGFCITVKITCVLSVANPSIVSLQFSPHVNRKRTKKDDCALPARCQPKDRVVVAGLVAIHRASREIIKPAKSDSKWAASVMIARLLARYPPEVIKRLYLPDDTYIKSKR